MAEVNPAPAASFVPMRVDLQAWLEGKIRRLPPQPDERPAPPPPPAPSIPPRFELASFANYTPRTPSQRSALAMVQKWVAEADAGHGAQIALLGATGTGKSHLLYAAAAQLHRECARRVLVAPWYTLADALRYGGQHPWIKASALVEAAEIRRVLFTERIVMLDEVRATAGTAFDDQEITKIAAHCYDQRIPLLITSNSYPLADLIGAPAASRFAQCVVAGPDGRGAA